MTFKSIQSKERVSHKIVQIIIIKWFNAHTHNPIYSENVYYYYIRSDNNECHLIELNRSKLLKSLSINSPSNIIIFSFLISLTQTEKFFFFYKNIAHQIYTTVSLIRHH